MKKQKRKHSTFGSIVENVLKNHGTGMSQGVDDRFKQVSKSGTSRKQRRKEKRLSKKQRRFNNNRNVKKKNETAQRSDLVINNKDENIISDSDGVENLGDINVNSVSSEKEYRRKNTKDFSSEDDLEKFKESTESVRKKRLKKDNAFEDKTIHQLEKKLHLNTKKKKTLPSSFKADGFDYILNLIDGGEKEQPLNDDIDEFFEMDQKKKSIKESENEQADLVSQEGAIDVESDVNEEEVDNDLEDHFFKNSDDDDDNNNVENVDRDSEVENKEKNLSVEDEKLATKYIPPALRNSEDTKTFQRLQRQFKGLLNRVSDSNLNKIANDIENMYRENSRAVMNKVYSALVIEQVCQPDPLPHKMCMETAMLICVVSRRVAIEILSYILEDLVCNIHDNITKNNCGDGKTVNNNAMLICNLYRLKITQSTLPIDLMKLFIENFTEKNVELILEILQSVGFQLRQDDPVAFKEIVQSIVAKSSEFSSVDGSRMTYMLDTLTAIKNNNARKLTQYYDPELVKQCRQKVNVASGAKTSETLPAVSLNDFLNGDKNGRWWVVGSAWAGAPMLKHKQSNSSDKIQAKVSSKLIEAARRQRMNTDLRRSIFYAIMTSDDYADAFEKIVSLSLKGKQIQDIPHVIIECCQQGKVYNAFYCHLLTKFCNYDRQYILSVQCSFWDRFKLISTLKKCQVFNLSKLLANLILNKSIPFSVLKNIQFTELDHISVKFLKLFFVALSEDAKSKEELSSIVAKLSSKKDLRTVCQGLDLYLQHFVLSDENFLKKFNHLKDNIEVIAKSLKTSKNASFVL